MPEEKITLDREAFKTLASDTRIAILKSLDARRKMLTELSKELGMSPSTVKEHMESLRKAGLVSLRDDGHKWKYYELTRNGKNILHPGETRIWIILSLSGLAFLVTAFDMLQAFATFAARNAPAPMLKSAEDALTESAGAAAPAFAAPVTQQLPYIHIAGVLLFAAIFSITLGYYLGIKKSWRLSL